MHSIISAKTVSFCTGNHFLEEDPKQKPTKNICLALCVIAWAFHKNSKGSGKLHLCGRYTRQTANPLLSVWIWYHSHKWVIWQFTPHCWKDSCYPSSWVQITLVSMSARSLTLKHIFLFVHARQQAKLQVSMLIRKYFSTCMILLQQIN